MDYDGKPVLSAYTPLKIGDTTWALIAEIDQAEVREPIKRLTMAILVAGLILAAVMAVFALFIANQR